MAFSYTKDGNAIFGNNFKVTWGSFTNAVGDTGGEIVTGLNKVESMWLTTNTANATSATSAPAVNETFPLNSGSVTVLCLTGQDDYWMAFGK